MHVLRLTRVWTVLTPHLELVSFVTAHEIGHCIARTPSLNNSQTLAPNRLDT